MSRLPVRGLLFVFFLGVVLGAPKSSAEPPTLGHATSPRLVPRDACVGAEANVALSWGGTQPAAIHRGTAIDYAGTACGRYVVDLDVSQLQALSGYGTRFLLKGGPDMLVPSVSNTYVSEPHCESLVVDLSYYRRPPGARSLTRFAGGRQRGVWHPEEPSVKCRLENALGFDAVDWQTTGPSGATRYRIATSARVGSTVVPIKVEAYREHTSTHP